MIEDGADIIDLGVESTRPGSTPLTADEEIERLISINRTCVKGFLYRSCIY